MLNTDLVVELVVVLGSCSCGDFSLLQRVGEGMWNGGLRTKSNSTCSRLTSLCSSFDQLVVVLHLVCGLSFVVFIKSGFLFLATNLPHSFLHPLSSPAHISRIMAGATPVDLNMAPLSKQNQKYAKRAGHKAVKTSVEWVEVLKHDSKIYPYQMLILFNISNAQLFRLQMMTAKFLREDIPSGEKYGGTATNDNGLEPGDVYTGWTAPHGQKYDLAAIEPVITKLQKEQPE